MTCPNCDRGGVASPHCPACGAKTGYETDDESPIKIVKDALREVLQEPEEPDDAGKPKEASEEGGGEGLPRKEKDDFLGSLGRFLSWPFKGDNPESPARRTPEEIAAEAEARRKSSE